MDKHLYKPGQEYVAEEKYRKCFRSMYGMLPVSSVEDYAKDAMVISSNDAEFHRTMMKKTDAYVIMPKLAHRHFFSSKSYVALPLEHNNVPLLHAAVYRKNIPRELQWFVSQLRLEMNL